eukprot:COSAG02_NODE_2271_length_9264_cov_2.764539_8_plen_38_part_00
MYWYALHYTQQIVVALRHAGDGGHRSGDDGGAEYRWL